MSLANGIIWLEPFAIKDVDVSIIFWKHRVNEEYASLLEPRPWQRLSQLVPPHLAKYSCSTTGDDSSHSHICYSSNSSLDC